MEAFLFPSHSPARKLVSADTKTLSKTALSLDVTIFRSRVAMDAADATASMNSCRDSAEKHVEKGAKRPKTADMARAAWYI